MGEVYVTDGLFIASSSEEDGEGLMKKVSSFPILVYRPTVLGLNTLMFLHAWSNWKLAASYLSDQELCFCHRVCNE